MSVCHYEMELKNKMWIIGPKICCKPIKDVCHTCWNWYGFANLKEYKRSRPLTQDIWDQIGLSRNVRYAGAPSTTGYISFRWYLFIFSCGNAKSTKELRKRGIPKMLRSGRHFGWDSAHSERLHGNRSAIAAQGKLSCELWKNSRDLFQQSNRPAAYKAKKLQTLAADQRSWRYHQECTNAIQIIEQPLVRMTPGMGF